MGRRVPPPAAARLLVFLHSGDYDRMHAGLSVAAAAAAQERPVEVYLFWWALQRLLAGELDAPDFGPGREEVTDRFERRGMPTLRTLLEHLRASGLCQLVGCTGSLAALGAEQQAAQEAGAVGAGGVDLWLGWSAILARTAGVPDRFTF
jgi:peroxiredoxin family protein